MEASHPMTPKSQGELFTLASLPLAWKHLRPKTQHVLMALKQEQYCAKPAVYETVFSLLAEDYEQQGQYHYAAGLYQYLLRLAKTALTTEGDNNNRDTHQSNEVIQLEAKLQAIENGFIQSLGLKSEHNPHPYLKANPLHQQALMELRQWAQSELDKIDQTFSYDIYDEEKMKDQEEKAHEQQLKKALAIQALYHTLSQKQKAFIANLVTECVDLLGKPPCGYAVMGLGSLAREEATPYSDFEFAILIEKENEDYKPYFRNLTKLLHLKVINLGETILPSLAIPALNDYASSDPLDRWFFDSLMPRGFAFDGSMPQACKTPLGKRDKEGNIVYELIHSPEQMVQFLGKKANDPDDKYWFDYESHLSMILITSTWITGSSDSEQLIEHYQRLTGEALTQAHSESGKPLHQVWALHLLKGEGFEEYLDSHQEVKLHDVLVKGDVQEFKLEFGSIEQGKLYDIKKEIYRLPDRVLERLAIYYGITESTVWQRLEILNNAGYISLNNVSHLKIVCSIALELRLRGYLRAQGQQDLVSIQQILALTSIPQEAILNTSSVFHKASRLLFRYYYTVLPLYQMIFDFCEKDHFNQLAFDLCEEAGIQLLLANQKLQSLPRTVLFDSNLKIQSAIYSRLLNYPEVKRCLKTWCKQHPKDDVALNNLAYTYYTLGNVKQALKYYQQVLVIAQQRYGAQHFEVALILNNLGHIYYTLSEPREAVQYHSQALEIWKEYYGDEHPKVALSLNNMAASYSTLCETKKALDYYKQALAIWKKCYGDEHPYVALSLHGLGGIEDSFGNAQEALKYHSQALVIQQKFYGDQHLVIASSFNSLAGTYYNLGQAKKALKYHHQALAILQRFYDEQHPDVAETFNHLGKIYCTLGKEQRALKYHTKALTICKECYGNKHPHVAAGLGSLGEIYHKLGKFKEALECHTKAREILKGYYGDEHPQIAGCLKNLGEVYYSLSKTKKALKYLGQVLAISKKYYGDEHLNVATGLNSLGVIYLNLGDAIKALEYFKQALLIRQKCYGDQQEHPEVAKSFNNLGEAYAILGHIQEALKYHQKALAILFKCYDEQHSDVASSFNNLAEVYDSLGDPQKALKYYRLALEVYQKLYGDQHPDVASIFSNLGEFYRTLGKTQQALAYQNQALAIRQKLYGDDQHPDVALSFNNLGGIYYTLNNFKEALKYHSQALVIRQKFYSDQHPNVAMSLNNLGLTHLALRSPLRALTYFNQALAIWKKCYGDQHPNVALGFNNLGGVYDSLEEGEEAVRYHEKALFIRRQLYGDQHPDVAQSYNNLGGAYSNVLKQHIKAIDYYQQALAIWHTVYGDEHPYTINAQRSLHRVYNLIQAENSVSPHWVKPALNFVATDLSKYEKDLRQFAGQANTTSRTEDVQQLLQVLQASANLSSPTPTALTSLHFQGLSNSSHLTEIVQQLGILAIFAIDNSHIQHHIACCYHIAALTTGNPDLWSGANYYFQQALSYQFDSGIATEYGLFLCEQQQYEEAIFYFVQALELADTSHVLSASQLQPPRLPQSLWEDYHTPGTIPLTVPALACYGLFIAYSHTQQLNEAKTLLQKAINSSDPLICLLLGYACQVIGRYADAIELFKQASHEEKYTVLGKRHIAYCSFLLSAENKEEKLQVGQEEQNTDFELAAALQLSLRPPSANDLNDLSLVLLPSENEESDKELEQALALSLKTSGAVPADLPPPLEESPPLKQASSHLFFKPIASQVSTVSSAVKDQVNQEAINEEEELAQALALSLTTDSETPSFPGTKR